MSSPQLGCDRDCLFPYNSKPFSRINIVLHSFRSECRFSQEWFPKEMRTAPRQQPDAESMHSWETLSILVSSLHAVRLLSGSPGRKSAVSRSYEGGFRNSPGGGEDV